MPYVSISSKYNLLVCLRKPYDYSATNPHPRLGYSVQALLFLCSSFYVAATDASHDAPRPLFDRPPRFTRRSRPASNCLIGLLHNPLGELAYNSWSRIRATTSRVSARLLSFGLLHTARLIFPTPASHLEIRDLLLLKPSIPFLSPFSSSPTRDATFTTAAWPRLAGYMSLADETELELPFFSCVLLSPLCPSS